MKPPYLQPLPIDPLLPELLRVLEERNTAVVTAEPGAGKTTRVPPALLSAPFAEGREIWVLQPRRIAAKLAAFRVAEEMGEKPGERVGYQFRFEKCLGPKTRLRFLTDGMLLPLARSDPRLERVAAVALDEFHERSLALELGLGFLRRLQLGTRHDLRLIVMSATLDTGALSAYLSNAPVLKSEGRVFPVGVEYHPFPERPDLSQKVRAAANNLAARGMDGTALVFLPGVPEIKRCSRALAGGPFGTSELYGDLPVEEQRRVLSPLPGKRLILCTNVAETSLTVPGVTAVVDSGLTRQARVSPWSGLESLVTVPASQASATQRAGRAGRLSEGLCLRLYSKFDFEHRAAFDLPEIARADLSRAALDILDLGAGDLGAFPWFLKPPAGSLEAALDLLTRLGALEADGRLSGPGRRMARFPVAPRLARFLMEVEGKGSGSPGALRSACRLAALINEEDFGSEDLLEELGKFKPGFESGRLEEQLAALMRADLKNAGRTDSPLLAKALLAAFPDRVARTRAEGASHTRHRNRPVRELLMCGGGTAVAPDNAFTRAHDLFVVVEAQETADRADGARIRARAMCPIEEDWLLDLFPDRLTEKIFSEWNDKTARVESSGRLMYDQLVLEEKPLSGKNAGPEAAALLFKQAISAGPAAYCDPQELANFLDRVRFVSEVSRGFPAVTEEEVKRELEKLCEGRRSFVELREAGLVEALKAGLAPSDRAALDRLAPAHLILKGGRRVAVHYEPGKPPWIKSRLQDLFGMKEGPAVAGGRVPVVLHLLAPSQRPVQITADLAGFWRNHYPQVRRELSRRYPKHKWPELPA